MMSFYDNEWYLFSFSQISLNQVAPTMPKQVNNQLPLAALEKNNSIESTSALETSANRTEILQRVRCGKAFQIWAFLCCE